MRLSVAVEQWPLRAPFVIARRTSTAVTTVTVTVEADGIRGRGEGTSIDYLGETPGGLVEQIEAVRSELEADVEPERLDAVLPPGGARNAVDCALWDLRLKRAGRTIWQWLGLEPHPVTTLYTLSLAGPEQMAEAARRAASYPLLKLKLDAEDPAARLAAVREVRPDAELVIDANGSWNIRLLDDLAPRLADARVAVLEQPLPRGRDELLSSRDCPVPLCADESVQSSAELPAAAGRYGMVNIKLDKCGGLTDALRMVQRCRELGLQPMVGNMLGSSLAMAPAFVVAQACRYVDLDGPLWQRGDRRPAIRYDGAVMHAPPQALWG